MPPQPPQPLPDGHPTGRHQRRRGAPGGHTTGGYSTGGYPTGGYSDDYPAPYPEEEYQAPSPSPPPRQPAGSADDYPSGEYPTGAFTGGMTPLAAPGNQYDQRAPGTFDPTSDPMSRYEQHSVYDDPKDRRRRAAYASGGRASRQSRSAPSAGAFEVPWYRETWIVALGLAVALLIGVILGALVFG